MNTMRRSSISIKATAEKDLVMSAESSTTPRSAVVKNPSASSSSSSSLSAGSAPSLAGSRHTRRGSVNYATIRPRNATLSTTEGSALREEVAAQLAKSSSFKEGQNGSDAASPSAPTPTSTASNTPIINPSAGSAVSAAFASSSASEVDTGKKKSKKDKKETDKKDKESSKKDKELKKKKAEAEATAKAEAKAEKTKKRKTISIFGGKASSKDEATSSSSSSTPSKSKSARTTSSSTSKSSAAVATPSTVAKPETPARSASSASSTPTASPSNSSLTTSPTSANERANQGTPAVETHVVNANGEVVSMVDNIPEGAVALPNGDFIIGVESDAVNLDALTDATAKVMKEAVSPHLGTPQFDLKSLLEATKVLSTTIKSILNVSDVYALTLDSTDAAAEFNHITSALRSEIAKSLVFAIKSLSVNATDTSPLKKAMFDLSSNVSRLYKCLEAPLPSSIVELLQSVVVSLRSVVSASKASNGITAAAVDESTPQGEAFLKAASQAVVITMRLCSSVQDFSFASCKSIRNQRSLSDSAFALAQSVRGLIVASSGAFAAPSSETHANAMAQMLKTAAEYVRAISRTLRDEESYTTNPRLATEADHLLEPAPKEIVTAYLRKGCGLMASAKDKYIAKSNGGTLAGDEKQVLNTVVSQAQLVATIMEALSQDDLPRLVQASAATGSSMTSLQRLIQPILDTGMDADLVEETVSCLENIIRTGIQVKILASLIASHPHSAEMRLQLSQMCQLWGTYIAFLLDAFWRAIHVF